MSTASAFALEEQHRADGLAARAAEIATTPEHPSASSLHHYQSCARAAYQNAATHTDQPD